MQIYITKNLHYTENIFPVNFKNLSAERREDKKDVEARAQEGTAAEPLCVRVLPSLSTRATLTNIFIHGKTTE